MKEVKEKIIFLEKGASSYLCKCQVLVQVWRDKWNVKFIFALHTAKIVETDKEDQKGEKMEKPEITDSYNRFM